TQPEVSGRQTEGRSGEHIAGPRSGGPRPEVRVVTELPVETELGLYELAVGIGLGRIVPCGKLWFSAAIEGSAIHSCRRFTFSACIRGICASTAALSAAPCADTKPGSVASATPDAAPCTNSRLSSLDSRPAIGSSFVVLLDPILAFHA